MDHNSTYEKPRLTHFLWGRKGKIFIVMNSVCQCKLLRVKAIFLQTTSLGQIQIKKILLFIEIGCVLEQLRENIRLKMERGIEWA